MFEHRPTRVELKPNRLSRHTLLSRPASGPPFVRCSSNSGFLRHGIGRRRCANCGAAGGEFAASRAWPSSRLDHGVIPHGGVVHVSLADMA
jgi:hypothetical protein